MTEVLPALKAAVASAGLLVASARPALADAGDRITDNTVWSSWNVTPDILIPTAIVAGIYVAGFVRRRSAARQTSSVRHTSFFAGLACLFLALQSPIDAISDHLFFMHQIQHLLLRMLAPMLLAFAWPGAVMTAGTPRALRRVIIAPFASGGALRGAIDVLMRPIVVTALFVAALYFWEIPPIHDAALLNEPIHYAMHVSMLLAGLAFWWRIFDRRAPVSPFDMENDQPWWRLSGPATPNGLRYGVRLMMLWIGTLSNIVLGAFTALKSQIWYSAYDVIGRLFGMTALADEQAGGFVIWMPSSMMCLAGALLVVHWIALEEMRLDKRRRVSAGSNIAAALYPRTAAELIARARPKSRSMAMGLTLFIASVFLSAILVGVVDHRPAPRPSEATLAQMHDPSGAR